MGSEEWLDQIFDFTVERQEILRRAGKSYYPMEQTGIGVLHTTEGPNIEGLCYATPRLFCSSFHRWRAQDHSVSSHWSTGGGTACAG